MSEKKPDTPVVHLPWSHWEALTARLDALERRERSRDDLIDMALGALPELLRPQWPNLAYEVKRRHAVLYGDDFGADMTDRAIECLSAAPPPPAAAPAPDVIERVRKALSDALRCLGPEGYVPVFGKPKTDALREALRLLGDAP